MQLSCGKLHRFHVALSPSGSISELGHDHCQETEAGCGELPLRATRSHYLPSLGPQHYSFLRCFNVVTTRRVYKWNRTQGLLKLALSLTVPEDHPAGV